MNQDFANRTSSERLRPRFNRRLLSESSRWIPGMRKLIWLVPVALVLLLVSVLVLKTNTSARAAVQLQHEEWLPALGVIDAYAPAQKRSTRYQSGDNSIAALQRLGFERVEAMDIIDAAKSAHPLNDVKAGHLLERIDQGQKTQVYYRIDEMHRLNVFKEKSDAWQASVEDLPVVSRLRIVKGEIQDSLFLAASAAGLDDRTTMNMVDIFSWDIDFSRDMRKGDQFTVAFDELFDENGKVVGTQILAAEFINQGKSFKAIYYQLEKGKTDYYSPDGKSMRKTYLKSPVKYSRISSRFQGARKHPVLGYTRAHRGVDYAAPSGTPIRSIGDGRVTFAGWKGGYGRLIEIQHTNHNHTTRYGHMRRIAKGIKKGARVSQGQVIGAVGMSGLATGPHLHFEFRVRGTAVNPLTVRHAPAKPVPESDRVAFEKLAGQRLQQLESAAMMLAWE